MDVSIPIRIQITITINVNWVQGSHTIIILNLKGIFTPVHYPWDIVLVTNNVVMD